ncbi:hypothetical protein B0H19DRAFT_152198 [Mycena capillaripes]|nr:hypothetical protein B0H19DRAFT_152198 [Mycena capillaripes]
MGKNFLFLPPLSSSNSKRRSSRLSPLNKFSFHPRRHIILLLSDGLGIFLACSPSLLFPSVVPVLNLKVYSRKYHYLPSRSARVPNALLPIRLKRYWYRSSQIGARVRVSILGCIFFFFAVTSPLSSHFKSSAGRSHNECQVLNVMKTFAAKFRAHYMN